MEVSGSAVTGNSDVSISAFIHEICVRFGPRVAGTAAEARAARFLAGKLREVCDEVSIEEHKFSPRSLDSGATFHLMMFLAALAAFSYVPALTTALIAISLSVFFLSRFKGYEILERFYPRGSTQNVMGIIRPKEQVRQVVIFSGHHDSASYMPVFEKPFQKIFLALVLFLAVAHGILLFAALLQSLGSSLSPVSLISFTLYSVALAAGVLFFLLRLFLIQNVGVLGANDNLAAVGVVVALARHFAERRPKHVEIWVASFGAEEAGLKGSKRFAIAHRRQLQDALVINLEMVGAGAMAVIAGERMAGAKHSREVVSLILEASKNCGIEMSALAGFFGETDATSFTRLGIRAATIAAFDEDGVPHHWHLLSDIPENVDEAHLKDALRVCIACLERIDRSCAKSLMPAPEGKDGRVDPTLGYNGRK